MMDCKKINENLFLASASASKDFDGLKRIGITHIVCLAGKSWFPDSFVYFRQHFQDHEDQELMDYLPEIFKFLDSLGKNDKVMIHCQGGVSRSPTVVIGYLMYKEKLSYSDAYDKVRSIRPGIKIKKSFQDQLENMKV